MHALRNSKQSRGSRDEVAIDGLVVSGLTELALGALTGWPMAVGAWVNANAFGVLTFRPELKDHPIYKAGVAGSFISASWGFVGLAAVAWKRWLAHR
jgi:hypothetical protein